VVDKVTYLTKDAAGQTVEKFFTIGDYRTAFIAAGIACLLAAGMVMLIRPVREK